MEGVTRIVLVSSWVIREAFSGPVTRNLRRENILITGMTPAEAWHVNQAAGTFERIREKLGQRNRQRPLW